MHTLKTLQECLVSTKKGTFVLRRLNDHCIVLFVVFQKCGISSMHFEPKAFKLLKELGTCKKSS